MLKLDPNIDLVKKEISWGRIREYFDCNCLRAASALVNVTKVSYPNLLLYLNLVARYCPTGNGYFVALVQGEKALCLTMNHRLSHFHDRSQYSPFTLLQSSRMYSMGGVNHVLNAASQIMHFISITACQSRG